MALTGICLAGPGAALSLDLPAKVMAEERASTSPASYALPLAAFDGQTVPVRQVEGAVDQRAFRLEAAGMTTLALLKPLRDQVIAAGFTVILDCDARGCGGFDFRFGTDVMPEPDMHVDLGDFRFLSAERGEEVVSILVSRSSQSGFVQITQVSAAEEVSRALPASPPIELGQIDTPPPRSTGDLGPALEAAGSVALDDLVFASGAAALEERDYASLAALAVWLEANPAQSVALVGHTDASGSLAGNIALSQRRASLVRDALVDRYGADATRITAEGVGFLAPRATNQTDAGRQKNRRVEVIVTSTR